jgi:hypothetical protein
MKQCKRIDILIPLLGVVGSIDVDDGEVACATAIGMGEPKFDARKVFVNKACVG